MGVLQKLFRTRVTFSRLEMAIFEAVQSQLSHSNSELWEKQLQSVNKIHRSPDGKEVNLFSMHNGKADFPRDICYAHTGELKIAVVDLQAKISGAKLRARVWCVDGHVFSIEYKTPFTAFEQEAQGEWNVNCHIENQPA